MRFQPKSEEEIDTRTLLPKGEYAATVTQSSDETSKTSGNDQIHLVLKVSDERGQHNTVHDYLLEAMAGKLRHFCVAANLTAEYESGELEAAHCNGQDVRVRLDVEKGSDKFPDKNVVRDYLPRAANGTPKHSAPSPARQPVQNASAEGAAKKAFLVVWNKFVGEFPSETGKRDENWKKCFDGFFPGRKTELVVPADWEKFRLAVLKDWDPINGWKKAAPFGEEEVFSDADIPF
jgi:hypothetical protein